MKKFRKVVLFVCVLTCIFSLTACGDKKEDSEPLQYSESELINALVQNTETVAEWSDETLDETMEEYDKEDEAQAALKAGLSQFKAAREDAGEYVGFYFDENENVKYTVKEEKEGKITVKAKAQFEKRDVNITYEFGLIDKQLSITGITYEPYYTLGEKMKNAALNTVMGMGVVILILAFLSLLISLFKLINKAQKSIGERKAVNNKTPIDNAIAGTEIAEEEEQVDDLEVAAVIAAAIAAMEQTTTDGFVVRSIKRIPNRKWK